MTKSPEKRFLSAISSIELSHEEIIDNLNKIRLIEMQTEGRKILMRTEIEGINNKILRALGVKIPSFIVREDLKLPLENYVWTILSF